MHGHLLVDADDIIVSCDHRLLAIVGNIVGLYGFNVARKADGGRFERPDAGTIFAAALATGMVMVCDYWIVGPAGRVWVMKNTIEPVNLKIGGEWWRFVQCSIKYDEKLIAPLQSGESSCILGSVTQRSHMPTTETNESIVALFPRWHRHMVTFCAYTEPHADKCVADATKVAAGAGWTAPSDMCVRGLSDWAMTHIEAAEAKGENGRKRAKNMASSIRGFAAWCKNEKIVEKNELNEARLPTVKKCHQGKGARAFALDEVKRMILAAEEMEAKSMRAGKFGPNRSVLYCFLAHTGLRYGEAMRLTWEEADLDRAVLHVKLDKAGRGDSVPMAAECVQALKDLRAFRVGSKQADRIFLKVSHHTLKADMRRAGVPGSAEGKGGQWQRWRKFMITERLRNGGDPTKVQRLARHANIDLTTGTYNDLEMNDLRGTAESFGRLNGFLNKSSLTNANKPISLTSHTVLEPAMFTTAPHIQTPPVREATPLCDNSGIAEPASLESGCPGRSAGGILPTGPKASSMEPWGIEPTAYRKSNITGREHGRQDVSALSRAQAAGLWNAGPSSMRGLSGAEGSRSSRRLLETARSPVVVQAAPRGCSPLKTVGVNSYAGADVFSPQSIFIDSPPFVGIGAIPLAGPSLYSDPRGVHENGTIAGCSIQPARIDLAGVVLAGEVPVRSVVEFDSHESESVGSSSASDRDGESRLHAVTHVGAASSRQSGSPVAQPGRAPQKPPCANVVDVGVAGSNPAGGFSTNAVSNTSGGDASAAQRQDWARTVDTQRVYNVGEPFNGTNPSVGQSVAGSLNHSSPATQSVTGDVIDLTEWDLHMATSARAQVLRQQGNFEAMKPLIKAAALLALAASATFAAFEPKLRDGYSTGKECYFGSGCENQPTIQLRLACCEQNCDYGGLFLGCTDEAIGANPSESIKAVRRAAALFDFPNEDTTKDMYAQAETVFVAAATCGVDRVRNVALALASESKTLTAIIKKHNEQGNLKGGSRTHKPTV